MPVRADSRVKESSTTTGTGDITVAGAPSNFSTFANDFAVGDYLPYAIVGNGEWEQGIGKLLTSTTIERVVVEASSNANALVNFSSGSKDVFCTIPPLAFKAQMTQIFGDGRDGDVTISSGTTTLQRNMYYNNLTISGSGILDRNGWQVFVRGLWDLSNAGANSVRGNGGNGGNASAGTAGSAGTASPANSTGASGAGGVGATGVTGVGAIAAAPTNQTPANGGAGGAGGAGGSGSSGAGGSSRAGATVANFFPIDIPTPFLIRGITLVGCGAGGAGGSSGAGDGTNVGGGGGGGAAGGGIGSIFAFMLKRGASTAAGCITAIGGTGGSGASRAVGNVGGGAGGGGGGGGWLQMWIGYLIGTVATNMLNASGGNGGTGGTGFGTGTAGAGGVGGSGGRVTVHDLMAQTVTETFGSAGGSASGVTGGTGNAVLVSL